MNKTTTNISEMQTKGQQFINTYNYKIHNLIECYIYNDLTMFFIIFLRGYKKNKLDVTTVQEDIFLHFHKFDNDLNKFYEMYSHFDDYQTGWNYLYYYEIKDNTLYLESIDSKKSTKLIYQINNFIKIFEYVKTIDFIDKETFGLNFIERLRIRIFNDKKFIYKKIMKNIKFLNSSDHFTEFKPITIEELRTQLLSEII